MISGLQLRNWAWAVLLLAANATQVAAQTQTGTLIFAV